MKRTWLRTDLNLKNCTSRGQKIEKATYREQKLGKMRPKKCQTPTLSLRGDPLLVLDMK